MACENNKCYECGMHMNGNKECGWCALKNEMIYPLSKEGYFPPQGATNKEVQKRMNLKEFLQFEEEFNKLAKHSDAPLKSWQETIVIDILFDDDGNLLTPDKEK